MDSHDHFLSTISRYFWILRNLIFPFIVIPALPFTAIMSNSSNQAGGDGSGASGSQGLEIFTSLRYDPQQSAADSSNGPFYMLDYHRDRLQESAENFGFDNAVSRFEGNEGLDWLKETLLREVKSFLRREDLAEDSPCAVSFPNGVLFGAGEGEVVPRRPSRQQEQRETASL